MPIWMSLLLIFGFIACSSPEPEKTAPAKSFSSSSAEQSSSSEFSSSSANDVPREEKSSSSPFLFPLSIQNATGSGEYEPGTKIVLKVKNPNSETSCFSGWRVTPSRYEKSLSASSADSAVFTTPADSVWITAQFQHCETPVSSVVIGNLRWMTKNLNSKVPGKSACYKNKKGNCRKYGRLYDFNTAKQACPSGWRLPTDADWDSLVKALGENNGKKLKSKTGWAETEEGSGNGSDSIGFDARPSGIVYEGSFMYLGHHAYFWTATERNAETAFYRSLSYDSPESYRYYNFKTAGYAVRCVQDVH